MRLTRRFQRIVISFETAKLRAIAPHDSLASVFSTHASLWQALVDVEDTSHKDEP